MTRERTMTAGYLVLGGIQLTLGLFIALAPEAFADTIGGFGTRNDHLARDIATFYLALGVGLAAAAARPSWRRPILVVAIAQYVLHLVNHIADIGDSDPGWVGPFDVGILVVSLALFAAAWYVETADAEPVNR